jgi:hypothetical protein
MAEQSVESVFSRAWSLLQRNWIIVVPGIVVGIVVGILREVLTPVVVVSNYGGVQFSVATAGDLLGRAMLIALVGLIGLIVTQALVTGMAAAAWRSGSATLADATANLGGLMPTALGLLGLAIVAAILVPFTLGISILAYFLFTLYAFPAALIGNAPGFTAITESFRLTVARIGPTLIVAAIIFVIGLCGAIVAGLLRFVPYLGPIIGAIISQVILAYAMLVIVGEYLNLRASGSVPPPAPPAAPV